jgi:hypothetical protein
MKIYSLKREDNAPEIYCNSPTTQNVGAPTPTVHGLVVLGSQVRKNLLGTSVLSDVLLLVVDRATFFR